MSAKGRASQLQRFSTRMSLPASSHRFTAFAGGPQVSDALTPWRRRALGIGIALVSLAWPGTLKGILSRFSLSEKRGARG